MALRDLFPSLGRRGTPAPNPALPLALVSALADLDRLASARPELSEAGRTLARVLRAAFKDPVTLPDAGTHADPDLILAAWQAGVPAFHAGESPPTIDPDSLRARALAVCGALGDTNPRAALLLDAIGAGTADVSSWAADALADRLDNLEDQMTTLGLDPALARSVLRLALLPALAAHAQRLAAIRPEGAWSGGGCPNCGGPPTLAESRGLEQRRAWRCGLCAGDWPGDRLRCPFCGESDHRKLGYQFVEGEQDRYRLSHCDSCGGRLKVVSTLSPISTPGLLVVELATAHLDQLEDDLPL